MATKGAFQIDQRFKKRLKGRFERFSLEAGVLKDKPHREPRPVKEAMQKKAKKIRSSGEAKPAKPKPKKGLKATIKQSVKKRLKKAKTSIRNTLETQKQKARRRNDALVKANRARGLGTMEGGPVRLMKPTTKGTVAEIAEYMRKRHGIPYLTAPFENEKSKEMKLLRIEFLKLIVGKTKGYGKVEALLRAVIRVPFLKRRYGRNSPAAKRVKTFDRLGIDTGQVYRSLEGRVRVNKNVPK